MVVSALREIQVYKTVDGLVFYYRTKRMTQTEFNEWLKTL